MALEFVAQETSHPFRCVSSSQYTIVYEDTSCSRRSAESFEAASVSYAVEQLVKHFRNDFNIANIDIIEVLRDGCSLGVDGVLDAEVALSKHYV